MIDFGNIVGNIDWGGIASQVAGAAIQKRAQDRAFAQQQAAIAAARARQLQAQDQASQVAAKAAAQYAPEQRQAEQQQIQQQLTGELTQQIKPQPITAQGVQVGSTIPDAAGSTDYLAAKARETAKAVESQRALAALMGRIGSASELRRGEGVGLGDASQTIGRIASGANNMWEASQPSIEQAGSVGLAPMIAGEALRRYGASSMAMNGIKRKPALDFSENGMPSGPTGAWVSG